MDSRWLAIPVGAGFGFLLDGAFGMTVGVCAGFVVAGAILAGILE